MNLKIRNFSLQDNLLFCRYSGGFGDGATVTSSWVYVLR